MRKTKIVGALLVTVLLVLGACGPALTPAEFEVISLVSEPSEVVAGETVSVTAVVKNTGGSEGTYVVMLTLDGVTIETKDVAITPGSSKTVTFSMVKDAPGTYEIGVGELSSTFTVKERLSDPSGDLFNIAGESWAGFGAYIDITEIELSLSNGYYLAKIELSSPLPTKIDNPAGVIEWDLLVDSDCDSATGWYSPVLFNDIGVDYYLYLALTESGYKATALDVKTYARGSIEYEIDGNIVELRFPPETIGEPDIFNFVVAVRKYAEEGVGESLEVADKAPNEGHYVFPNHYTSYESAQQEDFAEVTQRLNSPTLVCSYLEDNFTVQRTPSGVGEATARKIFQTKSGDCDEYAILPTYWLSENGYDAHLLYVEFNKWWEEYNCWLIHVVCAYKGEDGLYYCIDIYFHGSGLNPIGPFNSISEICDQLPAHYGATDWIKYQLFDSNWGLVKTETKGG